MPETCKKKVKEEAITYNVAIQGKQINNPNRGTIHLALTVERNVSAHSIGGVAIRLKAKEMPQDRGAHIINQDDMVRLNYEFHGISKRFSAMKLDDKKQVTELFLEMYNVNSQKLQQILRGKSSSE